MKSLQQLCIAFCLVLFSSTIYAQLDCSTNQAYICDNFESYDETMALGPQSVEWTTWSGTEGGPEDGEVSTEQAASGTKSLKITGAAGGGPQDVVLNMGDKTSGRYRLQFKMYIPEGNGGYYNIQHFELSGTEWAHEIIFNPNGLAQINASRLMAKVFEFEHDKWLTIDQVIDIDNDWTTISVDGKAVYSWAFNAQYNGPTGTSQLGSFDFYALNETHVFYIDDITVEETAPCDDPMLNTYELLICDDLEDAVDFTGPGATWWTTWSGDEGGSEDGIVSTDFAFSGTQSMKIEGGQAQDVILNLGGKTLGNAIYAVQWNMYVPAGSTAYFNLQGTETPGEVFVMEVYFNEGGSAPGTGNVNETGTTFTYPEDEWFVVGILVNLETGLLDMIIDFNDVETGYDFGPTLGFGGIDFFSIDNDNLYYIDDVWVGQLETPCEDVAVGNVTGPSTVCFGETGTWDVDDAIVPTFDDGNTISGFMWILSTADISGSMNPIGEPSFAGFTTLTYLEGAPVTLTNDGTAFPAGDYFWTPVSYGTSVATFGTGGVIANLDFSNGCVATGTSYAVTLAGPVPDIIATGSVVDGIEGQNDGEASVSATGGGGNYTYEWSNGETSPTITGLAPGDYTVTVSSVDIAGCAATPVTVTVTVSELESVEGIEFLESLMVSPNPTNGQVVFQLDMTKSAIVALAIQDITGRTVASVAPQQVSSYTKEMDLSSLADGMYIARIVVDENVIVRKIQVNK